jgi:hypothetical protein
MSGDVYSNRSQFIGSYFNQYDYLSHLRNPVFEEETLFGRGCRGIFNKSNKMY